MKSNLPVAALLLLAACSPAAGNPRADTASAESTPSGSDAMAAVPTRESGSGTTASAVASEQGGFVLQRGSNTVMTVRFTRTASELRSVLTAPNGARGTYTAALNPNATVSRLEVISYAKGDSAPASTAPRERVVVVLRGDTAMVEENEDGQSQSVRVPTQVGAIPLFRESVSMIEQVMRRARVLGGERPQVPVLSLSADGKTVMASIHFFHPDSARLQIGETEVVAGTDPVGRLLGARLPAQGLVLRRVP